jgi:hypothetical protein
VLAITAVHGEILIPNLPIFVKEISEAVTVDISNLEEYKETHADL